MTKLVTEVTNPVTLKKSVGNMRMSLKTTKGAGLNSEGGKARRGGNALQPGLEGDAGLIAQVARSGEAFFN